MGEIETINQAEFGARLKAQDAPSRADLAMVCPICGTVQSMRCLIAAGAGATEEEVERYFGFSCVGRWTNAGPFGRKSKPGAGCDWTLGGLLRLHNLVVVTDDGIEHPTFRAATRDECHALISGRKGGKQ